MPTVLTLARLGRSGLNPWVTRSLDPWAGAMTGPLCPRFQAVLRSRACELWEVPAVPEEFKQPVRSEVPVLMISGEHDPVTPPRLANEAARHLPKSTHLVLPETGHSDLTPGCTARILRDFVDAGSMDRIDTGCVSSIRRPPFRLRAGS